MIWKETTCLHGRECVWLGKYEHRLIETVLLGFVSVHWLRHCLFLLFKLECSPLRRKFVVHEKCVQCVNVSQVTSMACLIIDCKHTVNIV